MTGGVAADVSLGRVLAGRYRLSGLIGAGGMARVYRAVDQTLDRVVAVKVLHPDLAADERLAGRFHAEATLGATLAHPDLIRVYDTGLDDGLRFIVMELVTGDTLHDILLDQTSLPPARAVEIVTHVCSALAAVHERGVVHGDVKPANIMVTESGQVKLIDFGTARAAGGAAPTSEDPDDKIVLATRAYCSPELLSGGPVDGRSDVYSLGLVLYRLLTGELPGRTADLETDDKPPAVPAHVLAAARRAIAAEPADRQQNVRELRAELMGAARGPATGHTKPLPPGEPSPFHHDGRADEPPAARRRPARRGLPLPLRLAALTALVMAAALMVVVGLTLQISRSHLDGELRQRLDGAARSFDQGPARRISARPDALTVEAQRWLAAQAFPDDQVVAVRTNRDEVLTSSGGLDLLRVPQEATLLHAQESRWWNLTGPDHTSYLALTIPLVVEGQNGQGGQQAGTLVAVAGKSRSAATWRALLSTAVAASVVGLVFAAVLAFIMMRRALRPLSRISGQVAAIQASGDLSRRVAEDGPNDEVGRLATAFNRMLGRLDDNVRSQRRFVADASHELRTPLTVAKGQLELAAGEPDQAEVRQALAVADTELDRMGRIVQELLLLAKLDEGLPLASEPVEVELILQEALLRGLGTARREAAVDVDPDLFVLADRDRLLQVLSNLVTNAVQHAGPDAHLALRAHAGQMVAIEVRDDGTGIAPADLPHVFDRFYRSRTQPGGAGLGLAIAASIVHAMDGRITVTSTPGAGTTFTVLLPVAMPQTSGPG